MKQYNTEKRQTMKKKKNIEYVARARSWAEAGCQLLWICWFSFIYVRLLFFGPLSEARLTGFFSEVLFGSAFFLRKLSFLGIVRNLYLINILRVLLLMIRNTMAAPRGIKPSNLCMLNKRFSDSLHLHLTSLLEDLGVSCFRIRIQL